MDIKHIAVEKETHSLVKLKAIKKGMTMYNYVDELVKKDE